MIHASRLWLSAALASLWCGMSGAQIGAYSVEDLDDATTLERSLFLCQWRIGHGAPDGAPFPVVCTTDMISTDDAVHETKQWWTYWARFSSADEAMKAKIRFNKDFQTFQERVRASPALAEQLLPQGAQLPRDDWRVQLVRDLVARAETHLKNLPRHSD